jgi:hypothetical protein
MSECVRREVLLIIEQHCTRGFARISQLHVISQHQRWQVTRWVCQSKSQRHAEVFAVDMRRGGASTSASAMQNHAHLQTSCTLPADTCITVRHQCGCSNFEHAQRGAIDQDHNSQVSCDCTSKQTIFTRTFTHALQHSPDESAGGVPSRLPFVICTLWMYMSHVAVAVASSAAVAKPRANAMLILRHHFLLPIYQTVGGVT